MIEPHPGGNRQSPFEKERAYGVFRTVLITYGGAYSPDEAQCAREAKEKYAA